MSISYNCNMSRENEKKHSLQAEKRCSISGVITNCSKQGSKKPTKSTLCFAIPSHVFNGLVLLSLEKKSQLELLHRKQKLGFHAGKEVDLS